MYPQAEACEGKSDYAIKRTWFLNPELSVSCIDKLRRIYQALFLAGSLLGFPSRDACLPVKWCGGWDLNPRTPTGQGPEPCAFDLSWQPPRERETGICFDKCLSYFASLQLKGRGLYLSFENPRPYPGHRRHFCQMGN